MNILEVRPEQIICDLDGIITTRPNSPYYYLKYFKYDNKRIAYTFSDKSFIQETFDKRIFNCFHNGQRLQLRQDLADNLARTITHHDMYGNIKKYEELFKIAYEEEPVWHIIEMYLDNVEGVKRTKEGFIIHDSFKIDYKGNAWWDRTECDWKHKEMKKWGGLCIVMSGRNLNKSYGTPLPNEYGDLVNVNSITITIIAKIMFLLNPDMEDSVFKSQLPEQLRKKLNLLTVNQISKDVKVTGR